MVSRKVTDVEILLRFQDLVIQRRSRGVLIARRECPHRPLKVRIHDRVRLHSPRVTPKRAESLRYYKCQMRIKIGM